MFASYLSKTIRTKSLMGKELVYEVACAKGQLRINFTILSKSHCNESNFKNFDDTSR